MLNLLSLDEAAKELRVSIHTMRAWRYKKKFPVIKIGRRVLLRQEDLEKLVTENLIEAKSEE